MGGIDQLKNENLKVSGPPIRIRSAEAPGFGYGPVTVDVQYSIPSYAVIDATGKQISNFPAKNSKTFIVTLERAASNWLMSKIQTP